MLIEELEDVVAPESAAAWAGLGAGVVTGVVLLAIFCS